MNLSNLFLNFTLATGTQWIMGILILCSFVSLAIVLERIAFFRNGSTHYQIFLNHLVDMMNSGDGLESLKTWADSQKLLEAKIISQGCKKNHRTLVSRQASMDHALLNMKSQLERGLIWLATLGAMIPFIGLLGTVIGIMEAFHGLSLEQQAAQSMQVVMAGISEALVATALGLFVAIPTVMAYNVLHKQVKERLLRGECLVNLMTSHLENQNS